MSTHSVLLFLKSHVPLSGGKSTKEIFMKSIIKNNFVKNLLGARRWLMKERQLAE